MSWYIERYGLNRELDARNDLRVDFLAAVCDLFLHFAITDMMVISPNKFLRSGESESLEVRG